MALPCFHLLGHLRFFHCMASIAPFLLYSTFLSYSVFHHLLVALFPPSSESWIPSPRHYFSNWQPGVPSSLSFFHFVCTVPCKESCSDLNQITSVLLETLQWFLPLRVKWKFLAITLNFCVSFHHFLAFQLLRLSSLTPHQSLCPSCCSSSLWDTHTHTHLQGVCSCPSLLLVVSSSDTQMIFSFPYFRSFLWCLIYGETSQTNSDISQPSLSSTFPPSLPCFYF